MLTASLALVALPNVAWSQGTGSATSTEAAAFEVVRLDALTVGSSQPVSAPSPAFRSAGVVGSNDRFVEPAEGTVDIGASRAHPSVPAPAGGFDWKPARYTLTGTATYYDNGTTAMRLPRGTIIRVCGPGGCIERTVTDYGPFGAGRIIDLYRPDFFRICACASWVGTGPVTVYVY